MENKGLLFIPDISGFTKFINETEIDHSRLIIQELLELLINANHIGLEISEIEGDAILFYKFGPSPGIDEIYKQVQTMFCAFHRHLAAYEYRRYCQCKACISAVNLTLKVVTHYGEFTGYNVKNFQKLIGRDIIVAHQLLKNDIEQHEYWLVTKNLAQDDPPNFAQWMEWKGSIKKTDTGEIPFKYTQLSQLKNEVQPEPTLDVHLNKKRKMISVSREYESAIIPLFHATGTFAYRSQWMDGVKDVEELSHYLPRVGMKGRCKLANGEITIFSSSYSFSPEHIEFSETAEKENTTTCFTLDKVDEHKAKLTIDYYIPKGILNPLRFKWQDQKKLEESLQQSLRNLEPVVTEINKLVTADIVE